MPDVASRGKKQAELSRIICWTRMQAESGQSLENIVARKEMERQAGEGMFFWGVGNAPSRFTSNLVAANEPIDVVFSIMKSRPKQRDANAEELFVWQAYVDNNGREYPLPAHVLVTSRAKATNAAKSAHYALVCFSREELELRHEQPFDHNAYNNVMGARIGNSQVTALVARKRKILPTADYEVNLRAELIGDYWVRLAQPKLIRRSRSIKTNTFGSISPESWQERVSEIRTGTCCKQRAQLLLF